MANTIIREEQISTLKRTVVDLQNSSMRKNVVIPGIVEEIAET